MIVRTQVFFTKLAEFLFRWRWACLMAAVALSVAFAGLSQGLRFDGSVSVWFIDNDPAVERLETFRRSFGNDHFVYILLEPERGGDIFTPETVRSLRDLAHELRIQVPFLKNLFWVGNAEGVRPTQEGIEIFRLFEDGVPTRPEAMKDKRQKALAEKDFIGRYISANGKTAGILLEMQPYPEGTENPEAQIAETVFTLLKDKKYAGLKSWVVGEPAFMYSYAQLAGGHTIMLFSICVLVQFVLIAFLLRSVRLSLIPFVIMVFTLVWTFGFIGLLNFDLDLMIIGLPIILLCVCVGDVVHMLTAFRENQLAGMPRKEAIQSALAKVAWPCILTTLTTAAGFFSLLAAPIKPFRHMGWYVTGGVLFALMLSFLLVPALCSFGKDHPGKIAGPKNPGRLDRLFTALFNGISTLTIGKPRMVIAFFAVLGALGLIGSFFIQIESNNRTLLTTKVPMRQAIDHVDATMGGSMSMEVILDTHRADGIKNLAFLHGVTALEETVQCHPYVQDVTSVTLPLKKVRKAVHGGEDAFFTLPDSDQGVTDYLFLYEMAGGDQLDKLVSFDCSAARINIRTSSLGTAEARELSALIRQKAAELFPPTVTVDTTGTVDLSVALTDNIALGQNTSFLLALSIIGILMMITTRSVKMGAISMLPNIFPVLMVLGVLGATGIAMDSVLMSVSTMILGVATDDTVHFYIHFRREFSRRKNYADALRRTLHGIGRPLLYTTLTLSLGFLTLTVSVITGWIKIGLFAGFAFAWALLADLLLVPALIVLLRPLGPEEDTSSEEPGCAMAAATNPRRTYV